MGVSALGLSLYRPAVSGREEGGIYVLLQLAGSIKFDSTHVNFKS